MTKRLLEQYPKGLPTYGADVNPHINAKEEDNSILPMLSSSVGVSWTSDRRIFLERESYRIR